MTPAVYCLSKRLAGGGNSSASIALRRDGSGNTAVAVDPGVVDTQLARKYLVGELDLLPGLLRPLVRPLWQAAVPWLMLPPQTAAETMLYAATAPAAQVRMAAVLQDTDPSCAARLP